MMAGDRVEFKVRKDKLSELDGTIVNLTERVWDVHETSTVETVSPDPNSGNQDNPNLIFRTYSIIDASGNGHYNLRIEPEGVVLEPHMGSYGRWREYLSEVGLVE